MFFLMELCLLDFHVPLMFTLYFHNENHFYSEDEWQFFDKQG